MGVRFKKQSYYQWKLYKTHDHSFKNKLEISTSRLCGCFCCCHTFPKYQIIYFGQERDGQYTAFCPKCGIDSVFGSASGISLDLKTLSKYSLSRFGEKYKFKRPSMPIDIVCE